MPVIDEDGKVGFFYWEPGLPQGEYLGIRRDKMSDLHVTPGNEGFGLIDHIKALDERVGRLEMLLAEKFPTPFVYTEGWDKGFAGEGDPYGISEYTDQSFNPDAAKPDPIHASSVDDAGFYIEELGPNVFRLTKGTAHLGDFLTREDAEKAEAIAKAA